MKLENLIELPIKIVLNDHIILDLLCTPSDTDNLFTGFLFSQGYIEKSEDIISINLDLENLTVYIKANTKPKLETPMLSNLASIALKNYSENTIKTENVPHNIAKLGEYLTERKTKGLHAAIICYGDEIIFKEDISRHCAIDKAVGECIIKNIDLTRSILVTTGRISTEFLFKAKMLNMPLIASLKYPSITGLIIAKEWNINLAVKICSNENELFLNAHENYKNIKEN